jgi:epoxyqueuosine reductase
MNENESPKGRLRKQILENALQLGAAAAGIAAVADLRRSPTYPNYDRDPYRPSYRGIEWPAKARSLLVLATSHPEHNPELDWWGAMPGGTKGNLHLIRLANRICRWLEDETPISPVPLPYQVEEGGVFLKDAAHLAGVGVIGRNNLLITPQSGNTVRLRAISLDLALEPTGPLAFDPCHGCPAPCFDACPQGAFDSGHFARARCELQMNINRANRVVVPSPVGGEEEIPVVQSCRICEFACPESR